MKQATFQMKQPSWVADEDVWNKAKAVVDKAKTPPENYYAVVTTVYKNMGGTVKSGSSEADSGSSFPQMTRKGVAEAFPHGIIPHKHKKRKPAKTPHHTDKLAHHNHVKKAKKTDGHHRHEECEVRFLVHKIREAAGDAGDSGSVFEVYLIEEGLGNFKDLFYYPADTIEAASSVFTGKKIYADHPAGDEEQTRPERSVRDILGYFQEVESAVDALGRACLKGNVKIVAGENFDWARDLMQEAVEYSQQFDDQEFVGLSINASGEAEDVDIQDLLNDTSIPDASKVKLIKALSEGATTVRKVSAITDAVSCDLVTEAGAGGKVLAMIEQEKKMRTHKRKHNALESEGKHHEESGDDEDDDGKDGAADPQGGHADADQDKALIGQMIKKYMGKGDGDGKPDEADMAMAHEAFGHAKELGYEGEAAMHCAGHAYQVMKHAAMKHAEKMKHNEGECDDGDGDDKHKEGEGNPPAAKPTDGGASTSGAIPKESAKMITNLQKENVALTGRIAKLEESAKKVELEKYLEKTLKESKLPMSVTKKFRESIKVLQSKKDIDEKWAIFSEAYKTGSESGNVGGLTLSVEKIEESQDEGSAYDLAKCLR